MNYRILEECDYPRWDEFVDLSPQGGIYSKSFYLKSIGYPFKFGVVEENGEVIGGIVLAKNEVGVLSNPLFVKYLGVLYADDVEKTRKGRDLKYKIDREIEMAQSNIPFAKCIVASAYDLPFSNSEFDLVICCEVLEHLHDPDLALREIRRVTAKYCILSVPNEPIWRLLNMARGAYIPDLGNTPGHINHWTCKSFQLYVDRYFQILETIRPLPWVGLFCCPKD
jgi:SAM-dependent methyltransferase